MIANGNAVVIIAIEDLDVTVYLRKGRCPDSEGGGGG